MSDPRVDAGCFFDREHERYDGAHDRADSTGYALRSRMGAVLRMLGPAPGSVVDCGMGPGRLLVELERRGWSVAGVDASAEMVALASARLPLAVGQLVQGSVGSLPFPPDTFDAAVSTGVLEYVDDIPEALAEVERVLRPGGLFVASVPNTRAVRTLWRHRVVYPMVRAVKELVRFGRPAPLRRPGALSRRRLEDLLDGAGFDVERVEYIGFLVVPRPLEALVPSVAVAVARRLEGTGPRLGRLLGMQLVVAARKGSTGSGS